MKPARPLLPLLIAAVVFAAFLPALDGRFLNWDDDINFLDNPAFRGLGWAQLRWMWTANLSGHYIPLTWMSLGLNYALGGMNPWGYHLGNMLLHAASAALFYLVARRLIAATGLEGRAATTWGAAFAALVFGLHPLRAESVAWITERRDVLCGFFFLLTVLTYLRSLDPGARRGWRVASVAAFAAALLSKAQVVPLPVALLIVDLYPLRRLEREGWRRILIEKAPYVALSLAGGGVALLAVKTGASFTEYSQYGVGARLAMTAYGLAFYPWKWLWPVGLTPLYELPARVEPMSPQFAVPAIALVAVTAVLIAVRKRWPGGLAAWAYSAAMLLPVVGPLHAGNQLAHDRYSYLSGLGFAVLAGAGLAWVLAVVARGGLRPMIAHAALAAAAFVAIGLASATWVQAAVWRDSDTLWSWAVDVDPGCAICLNNLALAAMTRRDAREAEGALRRSLTLREHAMTRNNLGGVLQVQGRTAEAEREYRRAIVLRPDLGQALANLGELYATQGRYAEALPPLRRVFEVSPGHPRLRATLAVSLVRRGEELKGSGRSDEAETLFAEARRLTP